MAKMIIGEVTKGDADVNRTVFARSDVDGLEGQSAGLKDSLSVWIGPSTGGGITLVLGPKDIEAWKDAIKRFEANGGKPSYSTDYVDAL